MRDVRMRRYDVSVSDGSIVEMHRAVGYAERNRLVDFAFRHGLRHRVADAPDRTRGEGTYR